MTDPVTLTPGAECVEAPGIGDPEAEMREQAAEAMAAVEAAETFAELKAATANYLSLLTP